MTRSSDLPTKPHYFIWLALALFLIQIIIGLIIKELFNDWPTRGQFGDMYGFVNTFFSGIALAGAIYALMIQQNILRMQRKDSQLQSFENNFFQLLNLHNEIINNISYEKIQGRSAFKKLMYDFDIDLSIETRNMQDRYELLNILNERYHSKCLARAEIGHYFRNLYQIIKYVDESNIENKKKYTSIVRAQLSVSEHTLLFFNCLTESGEAFKKYVNEYALLENIIRSEVMEKYLVEYKKQAYGSDAI